MVKTNDKKPNAWMDLVKQMRDENPGMALKDVLRLASKKRGNNKSTGDRKKRGGVLPILPMLGGEGGSVPDGPMFNNPDNIFRPPAAAVPPAAAGQNAADVPPAAAGQNGEVVQTGGKKRSNKSHRKSNKSKKSSRKSKSKKSSKRRH
jgi:hypothetical protein